MNHLQRQLDERRRQLRLSYPKLAEATGLPQSTLWNILNREMKQPPKQEQVEALAKGLDWYPPYLLQLVGEQFGFHVYEDRSPELQQIIVSWESLSVRDRRTIARMVEELRRTHNDG